MLDLDYGSDSDTEQTPAPPPPPPSKPSGLAALLPKPKSRKQKEAEGANKDAPKKIVVNLPKFDDVDEDAPPAKKARTGGGGSGLSALLPAPKKSGATKQHAPPPPAAETVSEEAATSTTEEIKKPAPTTGSNTMFVPQSVARKPIQPMSAFKKKGAAGAGAKPKVEAPKPTVSLFGTIGAAPRPQVARPVAASEYKPIMLEAAQPMRRPVDTDEEPAFEESVEMVQQSSYAEVSGVTQVQPANDLDSLAREAGLDEAAVCVFRG
jgi:hypothetical protein